MHNRQDLNDDIKEMLPFELRLAKYYDEAFRWNRLTSLNISFLLKFYN